MRKHAVLVAAAAALLSTSPASAAILAYSTSLSGAAESPPVVSLGTGTSSVVIDTVLNTMTLNVSFSGLTGTTTAAHIHCCTAVPGAGNVGVVTQLPSFSGFPLGVMNGNYSNVFDMTLASSYNPAFVTANGGTPAGALARLITGLNSGSAYINVHSSFAPGGEIRGFFAAVPEPASWLTMILGIGMIGGALRRGRQRAIRAASA